jgi:hypothetical protein
MRSKALPKQVSEGRGYDVLLTNGGGKVMITYTEYRRSPTGGNVQKSSKRRVMIEGMDGRMDRWDWEIKK